MAIYRGALICVDRYQCWATAPGRIVVRRTGAIVPRNKVDRVSVDEVRIGDFVNTYETKALDIK